MFGVVRAAVPAVTSYFNMVDKISAPGYVATVEDLLKSRVRTSGIVEEAYRIDGVDFVYVATWAGQGGLCTHVFAGVVDRRLRFAPWCDGNCGVCRCVSRAAACTTWVVSETSVRSGSTASTT